MPTTDPSEGFSGLQQWSEPLIFDRLFDAYTKLLSDDRLARGLTRLHARVWRALISGDLGAFEALRETLPVLVKSRPDLATAAGRLRVERPEH